MAKFSIDYLMAEKEKNSFNNNDLKIRKTNIKDKLLFLKLNFI